MKRRYIVRGREISGIPFEETLTPKETDPWQAVQFTCVGMGTKSCGRVTMQINLRTGHVLDQHEACVIGDEEFYLQNILNQDKAAFLHIVSATHNHLHHPGSAEVELRR